jgi:hypothetical protein
MASFFVMASRAKCKAGACFVQAPLELPARSAVCLAFREGGHDEEDLDYCCGYWRSGGPALADEVGVRVGPVGAGVTVGESHRDYDRDRDRDRTVIREREPSERTTVIKKEHGDGTESKTVIHRDND